MDTAPHVLVPAEADQPHADQPHTGRPRAAWRTRILWSVLIVYGITLATIALWPTHVDAPADRFLTAITRAVPWLTYPRIEFTANILLFVPFGALLSLLLPRVRWWYGILAAALFSSTAELLQTLASDRTSTIQDVLANTLGATLGIVVVALTSRRARGSAQGRPIP